MICDIHHHVVYGVDDGARDRDMSIRMLEKAASEGVTHLVCSSHITPGRPSLNMDRYLRHFDDLCSIVRERDLGLRLYTGSEILYSEYTPHGLKIGEVPTLAATWTVLVEFWPDVTYDVIKRAAADLMNEGFCMVCAHVERFACLREGDKLAELRERYLVKTQMNGSTILHSHDFFGDRWVKRVLHDDLIDIAASDAHNVDTRCCKLGQVYDFLQKHYGTDRAEDLCWNHPAELLQLK